MATTTRHNHPLKAFGALQSPGRCPRCDQRRAELNTAELNTAGRTQHNHAGPFGFRRVAGCPRCIELTAGAAPRDPGPAAENWQRRRDHDEQVMADLRTHDCTVSRCGIVCTFGDW